MIDKEQQEWEEESWKMIKQGFNTNRNLAWSSRFEALVLEEFERREFLTLKEGSLIKAELRKRSWKSLTDEREQVRWFVWMRRETSFHTNKEVNKEHVTCVTYQHKTNLTTTS